MAIVNTAWDGSASRFASTADYCASCLLDLNPSGTPADKKTQSNCKLPVREPNGDINANALSAAAAALAGARNALAGVTPKDKKAAARKLMDFYGQAKMPPPDSLKNLAR